MRIILMMRLLLATIVCKKEKIVHYYPRLYSEGGLP